MRKTKSVRVLVAVCASLLFGASAQAAHPMWSMEQVAEKADIILVGTAARQETRFAGQRSMILTDVQFTDVKVLHATPRSVQAHSPELRLTYAGGCVGDLCVDVSESPAIETGGRYLLFLRDDGQVYMNPLAGGPRGLYLLEHDTVLNQDFVLDSERRPIGMGAQGTLAAGTRRVAAMRGGAVVPAPGRELPLPRMSAPVPVDASDRAWSAAIEESEGDLQPLTLGELVDHLHGLGLVTETSAVTATSSHSTPTRSAASLPGPLGGKVGYCGYHRLPFLMQTVPASWWSHDTFENSMWQWNQYMDVYRVLSSDGGYGALNGQNEIVGWLNDADLSREYDTHWGDALAKCISWYYSSSPCGIILESDIVFNSAESWSDNFATSLGNAGVYYLKPVAMHEMAHSLGIQRGTWKETYDYDIPTVVQPIYQSLVEDGMGLHAVDAYMLREIYKNQKPILNKTDVGVESYFATNGLNNSTTDRTVYSTDDTISITKVTVENMGHNPAANVRIRFFLSGDRDITPGDYQVGSYYEWNRFDAESYSVDNYSTTIPSGVPTGDYYLGAIVTMNGFGGDNFKYNNATSFYSSIRVNKKSGGGGSAGWLALILAGAAGGIRFLPLVRRTSARRSR